MAKKPANHNVDPEQFKKDIGTARSYVSKELKKHGIDVDTRLLTTISVMTSAALKFVQEQQSADETRASFDYALDMLLNNTEVPF